MIGYCVYLAIAPFPRSGAFLFPRFNEIISLPQVSQFSSLKFFKEEKC